MPYAALKRCATQRISSLRVFRQTATAGSENKVLMQPLERARPTGF